MTTEAHTLRLAIDHWTRGDAEQTTRYLARFDEELRLRVLGEREVGDFLRRQKGES